jgi:hypothetical protein
MTFTDLASKLEISDPAVRVAVQRGGKMVDGDKLDVNLLMNIKI